MSAYKEKFINQIDNFEKKVSVSGLIINQEDELTFIDDTTGVIAVKVPNILPINSFVRVFGYLIRNDNQVQLDGQIIQDLSRVNKQIYYKLKKFMNQKQ